MFRDDPFAWARFGLTVNALEELASRVRAHGMTEKDLVQLEECVQRLGEFKPRPEAG